MVITQKKDLWVGTIRFVLSVNSDIYGETGGDFGKRVMQQKEAYFEN